MILFQWQFVCATASQREIAGELGALKIIAAAMNQYFESAQVQYYGANCLVYLSLSGTTFYCSYFLKHFFRSNYLCSFLSFIISKISLSPVVSL
jgi:hypothetical protein